MPLSDYSLEKLKTFNNTNLINTIILDEDRVPRLVIDECVERNESMLEELSKVIKINHPAKTDGEWWLQLHHIMILGLIPSEQAGIQLIECIDSMRTDEDDNLQEWFSSYWPALTKNKPTSFIEQILIRCNDKTMPWFLRTNLTDIILDHALRTGEIELEEALDWLANMISNEDNDWDFRLTSANSLLDFPRKRHLQLLSDIEKQQSGHLGKHFNQKDINNAFQKGKDSPSWLRFSNPWEFYDTQKIEARQKRWQKENAPKPQEKVTLDTFNHHDPYQHQSPKIGRNDPCPCGSGKKYKKCCLH